MMKLQTAVSLAALAMLPFCPAVVAAEMPMPASFVFGANGSDNAKALTVPESAVYSADAGFGFDLGTKQDDSSGKPFYFSVAVPEGNYKVTVVLGGAADSTTTVKAESRRLMLEQIHTAAGESKSESFAVNVRRPEISTGGAVGLDSREIGSLNWDNKLTLEFSGDHPSVRQISIDQVNVPTVYVIGDSTVTDQPTEPGGSWAQSLPRWFTADVAVSNHAESGETLKAFRRPAERRWDKILSQLKPGDYVFMQFGTNDMKKSGNNNIYPDEDFSSTYAPADTEFKDLLKQYAAESKAKGATPVIVSAMGRRSDSKTADSLGAYPKAALAAAAEFGCPAIDLNGMSIDVYLALGPSLVGRAFNDGTHPNTYGGYLLSRCVVEGIKQDKLDLVKYLRDDAGTFDPSHPDPMPDAFKLPPDPRSGGGRGGARRGGAGAAPTPARGG
ncbi:MAG: rhamnogalacturonan acetylesterase [Tepidisphaeraceae bacterium]|jgi:lysophospholipase L1-like esterase